MEVKVFGLTFRIEVVVICFILGWLIGAHLFCSCVKVTPHEGFELLKNTVERMTSKLGSVLDYKMTAGIEINTNQDKEVSGFMDEFQNEHEKVGYKGTCGSK